MGFDYIFAEFHTDSRINSCYDFSSSYCFCSVRWLFLFFIVLSGVGLIQICIGNILEPRLTGSSFNLSPIVILLNLALWGYIWDIPGMFLCVPFLIIITIILSHFPNAPDCRNAFKDGKLRASID